ncbi:MAG: UDP-2,3-diacylglucosamine diphosphatase [candidate division WOR-3 bacterium]
MSGYFFISDAHLGSRTPAAERRLADFLSSIKGRASSLYILGDLFEFWFSYRRVVPSAGLGVLSQIAELRRNGTKVVLFKGNHDVWFDGRLKEELGFEGFYDELEIEIDGKRIFLMHGDVLDKGFVPKVFRSLMRNRFNARLFSLLHPDVGVGLARWIARKSREKGAKPSLVEAMRSFAKEKIDAGYDFVIMGHSHIPERVEFERGVYLNIGDWVKSFTYGLVENGRVSLERF